MVIEELDIIDDKYIFLPKDENDREIYIFNLKKCKFIGDLYYPNPILKSKGINYRVIREKIMSLDIQSKLNIYELDSDEIIDNPVFFFVYNTDNYYHFVYDTLPYLITYFHLKEKIPNIKLLMNYSNSSQKKFYKFIEEFLEILNINIKDDVEIISGNKTYLDVYISSSYTHDGKSNSPPRKEIYDLYNIIVNKCLLKSDKSKCLPKYIYISRRTWINEDLSNIGTNYTQKRKLINEDELVNYLNDNNFHEIFSESLSLIDKISIFNNAEYVIGSIGGGMCNLLFSKPTTKALILVSPTFLEINSRFKHCLDNCDTFYFTETHHSEKDKWKKYMRVYIEKYNIIGEIEEVLESSLIICYSLENLSGWNSQIDFKKDEFRMEDCKPLDNGLNSSWVIDIKKLKLL